MQNEHDGDTLSFSAEFDPIAPHLIQLRIPSKTLPVLVEEHWN